MYSERKVNKKSGYEVNEQYTKIAPKVLLDDINKVQISLTAGKMTKQRSVSQKEGSFEKKLKQEAKEAYFQSKRCN